MHAEVERTQRNNLTIQKFVKITFGGFPDVFLSIKSFSSIASYFCILLCLMPSNCLMVTEWVELIP